MPFLTNVPLPQCLQHSSATRCLLARDHDRGCMRHLLEVKCLDFSSSRSGEPALALIAKELGIAYGTAWNTPRAGAAGSFSDAILGPDTDQIYTHSPYFGRNTGNSVLVVGASRKSPKTRMPFRLASSLGPGRSLAV